MHDPCDWRKARARGPLSLLRPEFKLSRWRLRVEGFAASTRGDNHGTTLKTVQTRRIEDLEL